MYPENPIIEFLRTKLGDNRIFLVGGPVRDLLLGRGIKDCDLMIEGDVFSLASLLSKHYDCKLTVNEKLLTATLDSAWGTLDIARARREVYEYPGALPAVYPAAWEEDLQRRDFTINALAIPLLKEGWGEVIDLLGGVKDLHYRFIRILHENSFRDDPTRLLRAVRFKNRLNLSFENMTVECLQRDWEYLKRVSPARRLKEWQLICEEKVTGDILDDIYHLGGWEAVFGDIPYQQGIKDGLDTLPLPPETEGFRRWILFILYLLAQSPVSLTYLSEYWGLSPKDREGIEAVLRAFQELDNVKGLSKRKVYRLLKGLPVEGVYYLFVKGLSCQLEWERFYKEVGSVQMPLKGRDLLELGLGAGPALGLLLKELEEWYWEGKFDTREEGLKLVERIKKEVNNDKSDRTAD